MPKLAISKDFLPDYAALGGSVRRKVDDVFATFAEHTWAGLHLEKLTVARDPRVRRHGERAGVRGDGDADPREPEHGRVSGSGEVTAR